jgi:hypothetical protein
MTQSADTYEPPEVIELGAVVDMTFGSESRDFDNAFVGAYHGRVADE